MNMSQNGARRAVTGVILVLIVFGVIFSAGLGYYYFTSQAAFSGEQAALQREAAARAAEQENLIVKTSEGVSPWLLVADVYDSGGNPVTITAVFVTDSAGTILTKSTSPPNSQFLVGPSDLNVSLPVSLTSGEEAFIEISSSSCTRCAAVLSMPSGTVYVKVLTARGNTFSGPYPTPPSVSTSTLTNYVTSTSNSMSTNVLSTSTTISITTATTLNNGFVAGTNSLELATTACGGSTSGAFTTQCGSEVTVYQGQEIIYQMTVTNYADVAMSVSVSFQAIGTNGAGVSYTNPSSTTTSSTASTTTALSNPYPCNGMTQAPDSPQSIPADTGTPSTATYYCTFWAIQGPSGGTVSFIGYAVGTYPIGSPTNTVTSAESVSNPVQVGNVASTISGPWVANYFSFTYASSQSPTWSPADVISSSANSEVMFQVVVTNTANVSGTVLQYSFLQADRSQGQNDWYIVSPVTSSTVSTPWTATPPAYNCAPGATGEPSGTSCSAVENCSVVGNGCVPVGSSVTLTFAVCNPDSSTFSWANLGGNNGSCEYNDQCFTPPQPLALFLVIVYSIYFNGSWHVYAQNIPFQGAFVTGTDLSPC